MRRLRTVLVVQLGRWGNVWLQMWCPDSLTNLQITIFLNRSTFFNKHKVVKEKHYSAVQLFNMILTKFVARYVFYLFFVYF